MPNNKLILRSVNSPWVTPFNDITTGSVLSWADVDNNFIYLKGEIIYSGTTIGTDLILNKINGNDITLDLSSLINAGDTYITGGTFNQSTEILTLNNNDGSSVQISGFSGDFTGNTSASCITDLWVSNIHGCSPITIHDSIQSNGSTASGTLSFAFGSGNIATGSSSHAEGIQTTAIGDFGSHAEGYLTTASGLYGSHAEGVYSKALGDYSHAEGGNTTAIGSSSHAEGSITKAIGGGSHAEGQQTTSIGNQSHAEGAFTTSIGGQSHAEGFGTTAYSSYSHSEGFLTIASGTSSHSEGNNTTAIGVSSHVEGQFTIGIGSQSHAQGYGTTAIGNNSHAGGIGSIASGITSFIHSTNSNAGGARSAVIGGQSINGTATDTVYVPYLNLNYVPLNDNALTQVLVRASDGTVKYKSVSSFTDMTVTGGTYNSSNGVATFTNNTGGTFTVSGFLTGYTDIYTTGITVNGSTLEFNRTDGSNAYSVNLSGLTSNKYASSIAFTANVTQTVTHNLNDTDVIVQLKDSLGKLIIPDVVNNYTSNTVDIKVSSTETYRVIILG